MMVRVAACKFVVDDVLTDNTLCWNQVHGVSFPSHSSGFGDS